MYSPNNLQQTRIRIILEQDVIPQHWTFKSIHFTVENEEVQLVKLTLYEESGNLKIYNIDQYGGGNLNVITY